MDQLPLPLKVLLLLCTALLAFYGISAWSYHDGDMLEVIESLPSSKIFFLTATGVILWLAKPLHNRISKDGTPPSVEIYPNFYNDSEIRLDTESTKKAAAWQKEVGSAIDALNDIVPRMVNYTQLLKSGSFINAETWLQIINEIESVKDSLDLVHTEHAE